MELQQRRPGQTDGKDESYELLDENDVDNDAKEKKANCQTLFLVRSCCCCCVWCSIVTIVVTIVLCLVIFLSIIPNVMQQLADEASISLLQLHISNATNDSVVMNLTLQLSNTGSFDATIYKCTTKTYLSDGSFIGTLDLPNIDITAGEGAIVNINEPLMIKNVSNFRKFAKSLLGGTDTTLKLKAQTSLTASILGSNIENEISLSNEMQLDGCKVENAASSDITIDSADEDVVRAHTILSFTADVASLSMIFENVVTELYDANGVYLGYAQMDTFSLTPGYNEISNVTTFIQQTEDNADAIGAFFSTNMMGIDQELIVFGPVPENSNVESAIDYCLNLSVVAQGSDFGDQTLFGMVTGSTQQGWTVKDSNGDDLQIRGSYTAIKNPLDVDIRITYLSTFLYFKEPLAYSYSFTSDNGNCSATSMYAWAHTGYGMYEEEPSKTYVDVAAQHVESFFVMGEPMYGQYGYETSPQASVCNFFDGLISYSYPCCFLFATTAAICRDNPQLLDDTYSQLSRSFIGLSLESNTTILLDSSFEVNLTYEQDFLPLLFGDELYQGYLDDLYFNCKTNVKVYQ